MVTYSLSSDYCHVSFYFLVISSLIANTRESSEAALNASNAYRAITIAINSALNASLEAIKVAQEASDLVSFYSLNCIFFICLNVTMMHSHHISVAE